MAEAIYLPKVGMTMEEATLTKWVEPDGAEVKRGQVIFEMETEKVQMEIEAEAGGALKHLVAEGAELKPGDVIGAILAAGESVPQDLLDRVASQAGDAAASQTQPGAPAPQPTAGSGAGTGPAPTAATPSPSFLGSRRGQGDGLLRVSPIARRLADENGIDVRSLTGSGPDGRVVERDVQRAIEAKTAPPAVAASSPSPSFLGRRRGPEGGVAYAGRRRTIGQRMHESLTSMAQLTLSSETYVDEATKMLHGLNREWRRDGVVVTLTGLIVRACAIALREEPQLNARLDGERIVLEPEVNIGVAVDQDAGLIVPVVRNADAASLKDVAAALHSLVQRAREDKLAVGDVTGGTFTVTSLEGTAVDAFTPIINPPQAAILGVGRVRDVAAFEGDAVVRRQATTLSLTFDHRVTDGAPAARFLGRVGELLGRPYMLM